MRCGLFLHFFSFSCWSLCPWALLAGRTRSQTFPGFLVLESNISGLKHSCQSRFTVQTRLTQRQKRNRLVHQRERLCCDPHRLGLETTPSTRMQNSQVIIRIITQRSADRDWYIHKGTLALFHFGCSSNNFTNQLHCFIRILHPLSMKVSSSLFHRND